MNLYQVSIGQKRQAPRLSFPAMALDAMTVFQQHADMCEPLERMEIVAAGVCTCGVFCRDEGAPSCRAPSCRYVRSVAESITARTAAAWSVA